MKLHNRIFYKIVTNNNFFWSILVLLFIVSRLATWFYPYDSDHWIFYYVGKMFAEGGVLYISAWDHKPPIIFVINAIMHLILSDNIIFHRILFTLFAIFDCFLFYRLALIITKKINTKEFTYLSRISLLFYVFFRNLSQFTSSGNNTENFGLTFLLLMVLSYFSYLNNKKSRYLLASGFCFSILFFLKGNFALFSLPIILNIIISNLKTLKRIIRQLFLYGLPLAFHTLIWLLYFYKNDAINDFFTASFIFSSKYMKSAWAGHVSPQGIFIVVLLSFVLPFFLYSLTLIKNLRKNIEPELTILSYFSIISFVFIIMLGSFYPYYLLITFPVMILGFIYFWENAKPITFKIGVSILILSSLLAWTTSMKQFYNFFGGPVAAEAKENKDISEYIKSVTSENDKIVAYTYGATFYELTNRKSGSRFISASVLLLDEREKYGFGFSDIYIKDMEASKPKYVIYPAGNDSLYFQNKKLVEYFKSYYSENKSFEDYIILQRNPNETVE
ncbi:hypothetical protein AUK11_01010 [bacterium CG2_30_37_16]|nr:MAG: hypothetical protein AUK11_01010 [bacterium CG2_30_37_16]PIP31090.1 MAG: hypothetical protein COX25_01205 [bacterium (Candidatus Howlettbacteria) CG23_combo_of_CG06-09_8_20_14_all_37_9]PJB05793.1 MAG: hypothetical protein CO123_03365 [bacterium (Candidatus Howlettbacteria) CG_4_9_14_3_um_filter_37_10]